MTLESRVAPSQTAIRESVRGNVLVVEDDQDCGMFIVNTLSGEGYGTRLVKSRDAGVMAIRRYLYDYIILDVRMSGMDIPEFMKAVSNGPARNARIVLTTAERQAPDEAKKYNILNWIGKPFTPEQLLKLLATLKVFKRPESSPDIFNV
jgi:CheY-like chemotaxis protein